jgi:prepilin-type N-terminal cleavage/methylation domain-containing protein
LRILFNFSLVSAKARAEVGFSIINSAASTQTVKRKLLIKAVIHRMTDRIAEFPLSNMRRSGFSLIELMLVIGVLGTLGGMSIPLYRDYQIRNDLDVATEQLVQGLARARLLSQSAQDDATWGFYVPSGTLYRGLGYATRDPNSDEVYAMPSTITTTGLTEVVYAKMSGYPNSTGSITLTALNREQRTVNVQVERERISVLDSDKLSICHHPEDGTSAHTLSVNEAAWPAHRDHGDALGPCLGESSEASSAASSVASSVASSAASSAAATCADRFSVAADGTVTTTGTLNVIFTVLGSDITFGEGGPEVSVYATRKKLTGSSYQDLFSGNDVDGGEAEIVTGYTNGKQVIVKVRGYYRQSKWLSFDQTYASNDQTGHVVLLRDGDLPPDYPAFDDQASMNAYLANILDDQGRIDIGTYDLVLLAELGSLNSSSADFQDAVILIQFSQPSC